MSAMSSEKMKFALNAATDTLPHNSNLALWRGLTDSCRLCGKQQTLSHVLNHCEVALKLHRYNHCHDAILSIITSFLSPHLLPSQQMTIDIGSSYHFPRHIAATDLRPDIVMWSEEVIFTELTGCYETNAHERKMRKYLGLAEETEGIMQQLLRYRLAAGGWWMWRVLRGCNRICL